MPQKAQKKSSVALLMIDVIKAFDFPDGEKLLANALPIAARIARLKERRRRAGVPTIYVNDNFGKWRSDAKRLVDYCLEPGGGLLIGGHPRWDYDVAAGGGKLVVNQEEAQRER